MDYSINPKAVEIIDLYMNKHENNVSGTERFCMGTFKDMCERVFYDKWSYHFISAKGERRVPTAFDIKYDAYFQGNTWYQYSWHSGKIRGYGYLLKGKCENYFQNHAKEITGLFVCEKYGGIEDAILKTDCFLELWNEFGIWFEERRRKFMEKMETDIQKVQELSARKTPQSHGGVANLLKVLTKTMEKQGADITSIAKVQYAVCVQAGIYIPDEFVRDVAVTLDMPIGNESEVEQCSTSKQNS